MTHQEKIDAYYKSKGEPSIKLDKPPTFVIPPRDPKSIGSSYNDNRQVNRYMRGGDE